MKNLEKRENFFKLIEYIGNIEGINVSGGRDKRRFDIEFRTGTKKCSNIEPAGCINSRVISIILRDKDLKRREETSRKVTTTCTKLNIDYFSIVTRKNFTEIYFMPKHGHKFALDNVKSTVNNIALVLKSL